MNPSDLSVNWIVEVPAPVSGEYTHTPLRRPTGALGTPIPLLGVATVSSAPGKASASAPTAAPSAMPSPARTSGCSLHKSSMVRLCVAALRPSDWAVSRTVAAASRAASVAFSSLADALSRIEEAASPIAPLVCASRHRASLAAGHKQDQAAQHLMRRAAQRP